MFEYDNYYIEVYAEDSDDNIVGEDNFKLEMYVYNKRGDSHNDKACHINNV